MKERRVDTETRGHGKTAENSLSPLPPVSHPPRLVKRWIVREQENEPARQLARSFCVSPIFRQIMIRAASRMNQSARKFLRLSPDQPHDLGGARMTKPSLASFARLRQAINFSLRRLDVTARPSGFKTALLARRKDWLSVPHRSRRHGIQPAARKSACELRARLIVDCGPRARAIHGARDNGLGCIVTAITSG